MADEAFQLAGKRLAFVGGGNMAGALIRGLLTSGSCGADRIRVSDLSLSRRQHLAERYAVTVVADNAEVAPWGELVVLAVKPQVMDVALASIRAGVGADATVVSVAAGVTCAHIEEGLGADNTVRVVRAMPNAAAMVLTGATAIAAGRHASEMDMDLAAALFCAVGRCERVPERLLDAVTGLSGSGPAYVMMVIDALADGGVKMGLPRPIAQALAAQTLLGAAKMQCDTGEHPAALKDRITSPGGTTIAGLAALEAGGVRSAFISAVEAATQRSQALGKGTG